MIVVIAWALCVRGFQYGAILLHPTCTWANFYFFLIGNNKQFIKRKPSSNIQQEIKKK